jgi:hypothetical protein
MHQTSQLGETTRVLKLDGETAEQDNRRATVTISPTTLQIETRFPKGRLMDTRVMHDDVMHQTLELTVKGAAHAITTRRYLKRIGPSEQGV